MIFILMKFLFLLFFLALFCRLFLLFILGFMFFGFLALLFWLGFFLFFLFFYFSLAFFLCLIRNAKHFIKLFMPLLYDFQVYLRYSFMNFMPADCFSALDALCTRPEAYTAICNKLFPQAENAFPHRKTAIIRAACNLEFVAVHLKTVAFYCLAYVQAYKRPCKAVLYFLLVSFSG